MKTVFISYPTWVLTNKEFNFGIHHLKLVGRLLFFADKSGFVRNEKLLQVIGEYGAIPDFGLEDPLDLVNLLLDKKIAISLESSSDNGLYINYSDDEQAKFLFPDEEFPVIDSNDEDSISRIKLPYIVIEDPYLNKEEFTIYALANAYKKENNYVEGNIFLAALEYMGLLNDAIRNIFYALEAKQYFELVEGGMFIRPGAFFEKLAALMAKPYLSPVEALLDATYKADSIQKHDKNTKGYIWSHLRDFVGFPAEKHDEFIALFVDHSRHQEEKSPVYTAPPFLFVKNLSQEANSEISLYGIVFIIGALVFRNEWNSEIDPVSCYVEGFLAAKMGIHSVVEWHQLAERMTYSKLTVERSEEITKRIIINVYNLIEGLYFHQSSKNPLLSRVSFDNSSRSLKIWFDLQTEDIKRIYTKIDDLHQNAVEEEHGNYGEHNVSSSLLRLTALVNPPLHKMFAGSEGGQATSLPFRFYPTEKENLQQFVLEFNACNK